MHNIPKIEKIWRDIPLGPDNDQLELTNGGNSIRLRCEQQGLSLSKYNYDPMIVTFRKLIFTKHFLIIAFCLGSVLLTSCNRELVNIEANNRCKCIKRVSNEIKQRTRKAEADGRRSTWSNTAYVQGVLKAGSEDCAALRRKSEHRGFVARMTREERTEYDQKVLEIMERKCPNRLEKIQFTEKDE